MPKSDTECCLYGGKANTIEPYATSPYVFDVPQYHLGEVEMAGKASPKKEKDPGTSTGEGKQDCEQACHNGEGSDENEKNDLKQWFNEMMTSGL